MVARWIAYEWIANGTGTRASVGARPELDVRADGGGRDWRIGHSRWRMADRESADGDGRYRAGSRAACCHELSEPRNTISIVSSRCSREAD